MDDLIKKVQDGWLDFDVAIATPNAMKSVKTVARVLGPRGLMPNPKSGTVTDDVSKAIKEFSEGRVEFKMSKTADLAIIVGKRSFSQDALNENLTAAIQAVFAARPESVKGDIVHSATLAATMSPGIKLDLKASNMA